MGPARCFFSVCVCVCLHTVGTEGGWGGCWGERLLLVLCYFIHSLIYSIVLSLCC